MIPASKEKPPPRLEYADKIRDRTRIDHSFSAGHYDGFYSVVIHPAFIPSPEMDKTEHSPEYIEGLIKGKIDGGEYALTTLISGE